MVLLEKGPASKGEAINFDAVVLDNKEYDLLDIRNNIMSGPLGPIIKAATKALE